MAETKHCPKCATVKLRTDFARNRARYDGLQSNCRECYKEHSHRTYARHKDRVLERSRRFYAENKERRNEQCRAWIAKNRARHSALVQQWAKENADRKRETNRRFREASPERLRAYTAARRSAKLRATPRWADMEAILDIYRDAAIKGMDVDHIVPLQSRLVCGLHVESNLQPLPPSENKSKGNRRWPDMW